MSDARRLHWALGFVAAGAVLYAAVADYQYKTTAKLAQRSFALGYLAAQFSALRNDLAVPSVQEFNFAITKLQATSAELGVPNPDALKFYGIRPWEDYAAPPSTMVADAPNWTRSRAR